MWSFIRSKGAHLNREVEHVEGPVGRRERERRSWPDWVTPGWYVACLSSELGDREVIPVVIAERQLAIGRTESGRLFAMDRYCVHQGASLADGRVIGETVQCPFHHFSFSPEGECVAIPNCKKIPARARMQVHPAEDRFGFIWVFVGAPEAAHAFPLPRAEEFQRDGAMTLIRAKRMGTVATVPKDIAENVVDQGHVSAVHGIHDRPPDAIDFQFTPGRFHSEFAIEILGRPIVGYTTLYPPCFWWTGLRGFEALGSPVDQSMWLFANRPVGPELTECFSASLVDGRRRGPVASLLGHGMERLWTHGFMQDIRIWSDKVVRESPVLCALDTGPIMPFRKWWAEYEQAARTVGHSPPAEPRSVDHA